MSVDTLKKGNFTLPGEAGYEDLTLKLAKKWGVDAIRDSDGTVLSDKITSAGFDIYSTICLPRADNEWAKTHPDKLQQNYLMSHPVVADGDTVEIDLLEGFFREQFRVNTKDDPKEWWQVFNRTTGEEVAKAMWDFDAVNSKVTIKNTEKWHQYTVNFFAYRVWEAISMYNHITNNWGDREHLMPIDPIYPETQEFMLNFLQQWMDAHPRTKVVRFTSMFYNFAWIWGDPTDQKYIYSDWGAYDFTVSPLALQKFEETRGYRLTSEDFINNGSYGSSHNVPSRRYLDWMDFMNEFVVTFGRKCIDLVHAAGKEAFMFYDDHWVGTEPYSDRFRDFNFDGMIKCVFNAFEVRKCANVRHVKTRELRLHPYLFPTGLKGEPTFMEGGHPTLDCKNFWRNIRRGMLRQTVDRIGLGGYLHLVEDFPDFVDYIEELANEFRLIRQFHQNDKPYAAPFKIAILTAWGKLRSWICNGHFNHGIEISELIESVAGLPFDVEFISFDDILKNGIDKDVAVIINAGRVNSSWSGGEHWKNTEIIAKISDWIARGGGFIGIGEPTAVTGSGSYFQLAHILGVDREIGQTLSHEKKPFSINRETHFILQDVTEAIDFGNDVAQVFLTSKNAVVLKEKEGSPRIAVNQFQKGRTVYLSGYKFAPQNSRLIYRAIYWAANQEKDFQKWLTSNINTDCAYYPKSQKLVVINSSDKPQKTTVFDFKENEIRIELEPFCIKVVDA